MKFTDGFWEIRRGVTPHHATQVIDVETHGTGITAWAATRPVADRGATLNQPLLTVRLSSPMTDVVSVRMTHHEGGPAPRPSFALAEPSSVDAEVTRDGDAFTLRSGRLSVRVPARGAWRLDFSGEGRLLTESSTRNLAWMETEREGVHCVEQLRLGVGELVYGLGERFTQFVKNGQAVEIWNEDGGTASEQAYKNVPFYLTNRGYGVLVRHAGRVAFEVGSEKVSRVQFSVPGESLEYLLIYGPTPADILARYTALTGRPPLPPAWSFGLWLTTSFTTDYDEGTVSYFVDGMAERRIPLSVFHFDCFWMKELQWCDFEWDRRVFPDPAGMLARLKARGLRICVWINPYIAQKSPLFADAAAAGWLLRRPDGRVWQWDRWQAGMGVVDFTSAGARAWFADKLRALVRMGVDCFKTDFGERIPTDVVYSDGSDPVLMHNYYTLLYNRTVAQALAAERGPAEAVVFARSATVGSQAYPVHWGGDSTATYESMAESLRGGLSLGLCGFGFWSHDIGGFESSATPDLYNRWVAFGLLSSHSRLHGSSSYRVPWLFGEESVDVLRFFARLKCRLMPYLYGQAAASAAAGQPLMRAMMLACPGDPACETLDRQYMLGDALLVAPVFAETGEVSYYLPEGTWTNLLSGVEVTGGLWVRETHGYLSLPLMARPGAVVPVGAVDDRADYDFADGVTFHVFRVADGARSTAEVPDSSGAPTLRLEVARNAAVLSLRCERSERSEGARGPWRVLLRGIATVTPGPGARAERTPEGTLVVGQGAAAVEVTLPGGAW
jgi:alpha-D-xyloside xylohydrolase